MLQPALFANRGFTGHDYLPWFNLYNMNGRLYDPLVGRFLNVDPVIQDPTFTQNYNRYSYCFNNPLKYTDLSGETVPLGVYDTGSGSGNDRFWERTYQVVNSGGATVTPPNNGGGNNGGGGDESSVGGSGSAETSSSTTWITLGFFYYDKNGNPVTNNEGNRGEFWIYEAKEYNSTYNWGNSLNPSTVGRNYFGLTYAGPNNPKDNYNRDTYEYVPRRLSDFPPIGHDRRYDRLNISGFKGLFSDTRSIGADWRFVGEEYLIASNPFNNLVDRFQASILSAGLGLTATPKTLYKLFQPNSLLDIILWYNYSNVGVTNTPGRRY